ncbi:GntR family transcriptional regulator, partial [Acidiphilium sp. PM]
MEPIETGETLIDKVYERVVEAIADGALLPGMRIRQGELAARLGVSRQPVSHALHLLHRQGL